MRTTRSDLVSHSVCRDESLLNGQPPDFPPLPLASHWPQSFLQMESPESFTYTYNLFSNNTHLQIFVLVESEPDRPNHYTFSLTVKIGHVERALSKPVTMKVSLDPRQLDFVVFAFAPRSSLPTGCLHNLRVWLRAAGVDHRIFGEKDIWFGRDPDFCAIADASFACLRNATQDMSIYQGLVGRAHVSFIFRWTPIEPGTYTLSLEYEAGGVGRILFEKYQLRLYCEPQSVSFVIYSIPVPSKPAGASHRLRVWLRTPHALATHSQSQLQVQHQHQSHFRSRSQPSLPPPPPPLTREHAHSTKPSRPLRFTPLSLSASAFTSIPASVSASAPPSPSYVYQRLWKSDDFKIGARLAFDEVGLKIILATPGPGPVPTPVPGLGLGLVPGPGLGLELERRSENDYARGSALVPNRRRSTRLEALPDDTSTSTGHDGNNTSGGSGGVDDVNESVDDR